MKPLSDFIKISINNDLINDTSIPENGIFDHFFIEFRLNGCTECIVERFGKYNGQIELASKLADDIHKHEYTPEQKIFVLNREDLEEYESVFYDKLTIVYDPNTKNTAYIPQENFNKKTQKLNEVYIILSADTNNGRSRIRKSIMHELTHAWHDYCSYIGKGTSLTTLGKELKYYHKIRTFKSIEKGKQLCKTILYLTSIIEKGAYSAEIYSELDELKNNKIVTWEQAKEIFRNSSTYKDILKLYDNLININNRPDEFKEEFVSFYNEINETNLTLNKIIKLLTNKIEKLFDKVESNCAKIYYEWADNQELNDFFNEHGVFPYVDLAEL